MNAYWGAEV